MTSDKSFPRQSRLLRPEQFKFVFDRPVVSSDRLFKVFARPGPLPECRLGLAVSRKVDPRAVARNRIKRTIRESFRLNVSPAEKKGLQGRDFVVVASPPAAKATGEQLRSSLSGHWRAVDRKIESNLAGTKQQISRPEE